MPRETLTHTANAPADRDTVWSALDKPSTWEGIAGVDRVFDPVIDDEGHLTGFSFSTGVGGRTYKGSATPARRVEGSAIAWNVESSEMKGVVAVDLAGSEEGTEVTVTIDLESVGMLSSLFFGVIISALREGLPGTVEEFAAGLAS